MITDPLKSTITRQHKQFVRGGGNEGRMLGATQFQDRLHECTGESF